MNEDEKAEFNAIGDEVGMANFADQVIALGNQFRETLDKERVERKSIDDEQVPEVKGEKPPKDEDESQDDSEDEKPEEKKNVAEELANAVADRLGLHDLSNTISDILETQKAFQERLDSHDTTIGEVKKAKEEEVATALGAPRYVWQAFQASKAKETATTPDAQPVQGMPDAVKSIASRIGS